MTTTSTPPRGFRAYPTKRHDGDSFWVMIDAGGPCRWEPELRLLDVRAPEVLALRLPTAPQPGGIETTNYVNGLLDGIVGKSQRRWCLYVETVLTTTFEPTERTTLSRYLAGVWDYDQAYPWHPGEVPWANSVNYQVATFLSGHPEWPPGN